MISSINFSSTQSEAARAQKEWDRRFGTRQLELKKTDPDPFTTSTWLGRGGWSSVNQIELGGIALALKRTYAPKIPASVRTEVEILRQVSRKRHRHIVELIGSYIYTEKRRNSYELGIVVWPVARCDLSHFLQDLSILAQYKTDALPQNRTEELESACETLNALCMVPQTNNRARLYCVSLHKLSEYFGCIAGAVAFLHAEVQVRHKDLKPAQILLSVDGLWLTDFGLSTSMADADDSATSGLEYMTPRYQAPERVLGLRRGRAEDIFGLGCIFLEMTYALCGLNHERLWIQEMVQGWSYQANVKQRLSIWLGPVHEDFLLLRDLLQAMLSFDPLTRPSIQQVVSCIERMTFSNGEYTFIGSCCMSGKSQYVCLRVREVDINDQVHRLLCRVVVMKRYFTNQCQPKIASH